MDKAFRAEVESILGKGVFTEPRAQVLMRCATEVLDAKDKHDRMKLLLEAVRGELRTLAAIIMRQQGTSRLVLTRKEFDAVPDNVEVHVETPEPGIRIYELRTKPVIPEPSRILQ
jgi:hypothetical protein